MSYLLTEIALEMLGYKFYDIYGTQDEINNFQNLTSSQKTGDNNSTEPNLATLLGIGTPVNADLDKIIPKNKINKELFGEVQANLPYDVIKQMDTELNKIRQQITNSKPDVNGCSAEADIHQQKFAQNFAETEQEKLREEYQRLRSFRKIVEQNLLQRNPASFEKYCQLFKPVRKQMNKRLDVCKK